MTRLFIAIAIALVSVGVAAVLSRRRQMVPTQGGTGIPQQLDRLDFDSAEKPWLVVVFTSRTCDSCVKAVSVAKFLASEAVAVQEVAWQDNKVLHERYVVDSVPCTLLVDADGVVRESFIGATVSSDVWGALAKLRA